MSSSGTIDLAALAATPRWPAERVAALEGRCRGSLMAHWAEHLARRFGPGAVHEAREGLGALSDHVPDDPPALAWLPAAAQVRLTDVIIDRFFGGDPLALEPALREDVEGRSNPVRRAIARRLGPGPFLRAAGRAHPQLYDVGRAEADVKADRAILTVAGAALFTNPTWQLLQLLAQRIGLRMLGREVVELLAEQPAEDAFRVFVRWR